MAQHADPTETAIASERAAALQGLVVLAADVGDHPEAYTRFVAVSNRTALGAGESWRIAFSFQTDHRPGALHRAIEPFARHGLDLVQLTSRPIPQTPWRYRFDAVVAGHPLDDVVRTTLAEVRRAGAALHRLRLLTAAQAIASRAAFQRGSSQRIRSGSTPRSSARSSVSSWNGTMSTTGWRVGTSVTSQPSSRSAPAASAARAAARPSPSSTKQRTLSSMAARWPCRSSSSWCASAATIHALAQLQRRLLRGRPVAAGAGDQPALVRGDRQPLGGELLGHRVRQPRDVLAAQRRERRDRAGVAGRVAVALLDRRRGDDDLVAERRQIGSSRFAVTSHFGPANACAASSVSGVSPSWLTSTSTSASGGCSRNSSASTPLPEVCAAWNEVPQPTTATRPSGSRRSTGTCASHSGWAATAALVFSPATAPSIPCGAVGVFERFSLENGLRVLTAPMPHAQSVSCFVMLAAGSRYETAETNGIAHFAEHMFFKGTERRPTARDIAGEIDAIGGEFNAFTGKEYTGYYVRCAAETRDTALDVLVDMLRNSSFDPEEIEREKGVIIEEMNMYFDTPRDFIGGVYESLLYGDQPLGWDIIGRKETVRGATRETFTRLHRQVVPARPHGRRRRRPARRRAAGAARGAARRPGAARDRLAARLLP